MGKKKRLLYVKVYPADAVVKRRIEYTCPECDWVMYTSGVPGVMCDGCNCLLPEIADMIKYSGPNSLAERIDYYLTGVDHV